MYNIENRIPNFELHPVYEIPGTKSWKGYEQILGILKERIRNEKDNLVIVFDYYHGYNEEIIKRELIDKLPSNLLIDSNTIKFPEKVIAEKFHRFITDDRINGVFSCCKIDEFFDQEKVIEVQKKISQQKGITIVYGVAASTICDYDILVYGNVSVQKIKEGYFKNLTNWGANNADEDPLRKEKRYYYLEGKVQDSHKRKIFDNVDYVIDGDIDESPVMLTGKDFRKTLKSFANRPFKLAPFFNKGIWGGNWCKKVLNGGLDKENTAWGMTGWMIHQSAIAKCGDNEFHVVGNDIISYDPIDLMGNQTFDWFGYNIPIGCDFLDTWGGGNLSLQVHPDNAYAHEEFNSQFGHYESYYMLDTTNHSSVYLGTKENVKTTDLVDAFKLAQETGEFDENKWLNKFPMKKHDHIYIPSGTIHASAKDTLVLEINPYWIQTFKLWDWGRVDADGKPRPINIDHGAHVIREKYQTSFVKNHLISKQAEIDRGDGWRKEHSGLMEYELMTIDRYWFSKPIFIESHDHIKLLILVEGEEAILSSPNDEFDPIIMHYAEAIFAPASLGQYIIKPYGKSKDKEIAMLECYMDMGDAYGKRKK